MRQDKFEYHDGETYKRLISNDNAPVIIYLDKYSKKDILILEKLQEKWIEHLKNHLPESSLNNRFIVETNNFVNRSIKRLSSKEKELHSRGYSKTLSFFKKLPRENLFIENMLGLALLSFSVFFVGTFIQYFFETLPNINDRNVRMFFYSFLIVSMVFSIPGILGWNCCLSNKKIDNSFKKAVKIGYEIFTFFSNEELVADFFEKLNTPESSMPNISFFKKSLSKIEFVQNFLIEEKKGRREESQLMFV